jgi:hypothetical protein
LFFQIFPADAATNTAAALGLLEDEECRSGRAGSGGGSGGGVTGGSF